MQTGYTAERAQENEIVEQTQRERDSGVEHTYTYIHICKQDIPLNVPKKTKLYVEQTQRERDSGVDMHRIFQRELCKLRLNTARAYVKVHVCMYVCT